MAEEKKMTLAAKLARIGKEIGAVDKSGHNVAQKYNYIEYGVVAGKIRELFDTYRIIIIPNVDEYQVDEIKNKYDNTGYHYVLKMSFTLINGDDASDTFTAKWCGESADYGDKGINKAETSGTKYFLMRLFNVSEKGEEEADSKSPEIAKTSMAKKYEEPMSEFDFTAEEIAAAKAKLRSAKDVRELKHYYLSIGAIRNNVEVIDTKNEMKDKLTQEDIDLVMANGKEAIDKQFNK